MGYGKKLKEQIRSKGLRFTFVSDQTGIPYDSLIQYLNEHRPFPEPKVRLICLLFGIDLKIFGLDDKNSLQKGA